MQYCAVEKTMVFAFCKLSLVARHSLFMELVVRHDAAFLRQETSFPSLSLRCPSLIIQRIVPTNHTIPYLSKSAGYTNSLGSSLSSGSCFFVVLFFCLTASLSPYFFRSASFTPWITLLGARIKNSRQYECWQKWHNCNHLIALLSTLHCRCHNVHFKLKISIVTLPEGITRDSATYCNVLLNPI